MSDNEWKEWVPEIVDAINEGELDAHLRTIVRAAYMRRDPARVIPDGILKPTTTLTAERIDCELDNPTLATAPFNGKIPRVYGRSDVGVFTVGDDSYLKADAIGKKFRPSMSHTPDWRGMNWRGAYFTVIEINRANVLVEIAEPPFKMIKRIRLAYENRIPISVDKYVMIPILERG